MDKYFICWSGNELLAKELSKKIESNTKDRTVVGGGAFEDMYVGAQVIKQMQQCSSAIILVEDKEDGFISPNLMFEWGYLIARLPVNNIYTFLINKKLGDLPSDLLGSWAFEMKVDRENETDEQIADKIFGKLAERLITKKETNYFHLVNDWRKIFARLIDKQRPLPDGEFCQYLLAGCLAAYYYMDYRTLRNKLDEIVCTEECIDILSFTKSYIDVFLESDNMMHPISENKFFSFMQKFDAILSRKRRCGEEEESVVDILCYNVYGLSCLLYLKNDGLDEETIEICSKKSLECFEKLIELITEFESTHIDNECFVMLMRAYIYNDISHLYKGSLNNQEKFIEYLAMSVEQRKSLHQTFATYYKNPFLEIKLEQEYIVALSEQCMYLSNSFEKSMRQSIIKSRLKEWEKELLFTSSLTERIKANIKLF